MFLIRVNPRFNQPHPSREQLLHHPLFDGAGFVPTLLQRGDLGVHVGEDGGDGVLLITRFWNLESSRVAELNSLTRLYRVAPCANAYHNGYARQNL